MIRIENSKIWLLIVLAVALVVLIVIPWLITGYWLRLLTVVFMYVIVAKCVDFMLGYTGYVPFGNVVFFGLGAYTTGILMSQAWPFFPSMLVGAAVSALVCLSVGIPVLRLRGHYFAVATIGLNGAMMAIALNATRLTGGAMGLSFPIIQKSPGVVYKYFYFLMFALMIIVLIVNVIIIRSRFGYAIRSIKSNEEAARSLGINTTFYKITTWIISAVLTSFAGAIYGYWMSYISTAEVFGVTISLTGILMVLFGGAGTIFGPVIGAFIFQFLSEVIWSQFLEYHLGILGIVTILVIFFIPRGILTSISEWIKRAREKKQTEVAK
jgi:branched-chain amino acid transport system permease protein